MHPTNIHNLARNSSTDQKSATSEFSKITIRHRRVAYLKTLSILLLSLFGGWRLQGHSEVTYISDVCSQVLYALPYIMEKCHKVTKVTTYEKYHIKSKYRLNTHFPMCLNLGENCKDHFSHVRLQNLRHGWSGIRFPAGTANLILQNVGKAPGPTQHSI
jgi:hypothetical protein